MKKLVWTIIKTYLIYSCLIILILILRMMFQEPRELKDTGIEGFLKATDSPNYSAISESCYVEANQRVLARKCFPLYFKQEYYDAIMEVGHNIQNSKAKNNSDILLIQHCPGMYSYLKRKEEERKVRVKKYFYGERE